MLFNGVNLLELEPMNAHAGLFSRFRIVEIPGINNVYFLKAAVNAARDRGDWTLRS